MSPSWTSPFLVRCRELGLSVSYQDHSSIHRLHPGPGCPALNIRWPEGIAVETETGFPPMSEAWIVTEREDEDPRDGYIVFAFSPAGRGIWEDHPSWEPSVAAAIDQVLRLIGQPRGEDGLA